MRGLVTVGPSLDPAAFEAPANVVVHRCSRRPPRFSPTQGMVIRALRYTWCVPIGHDQGDDAAHVVARGAGLHLSREAPAAEIREVIQSVVEQPRFREGARAADISEPCASSKASSP